jgi:hypothetical protein
LYKLVHRSKQVLGTEAGRSRMRYGGDARTCRCRGQRGGMPRRCSSRMAWGSRGIRERSAPAPTNVHSRRPVLIPLTSLGMQSTPGITASVVSGMVNEATSASWSAAGGLCSGVPMLTGPTPSSVGSEPAKGREVVCADTGTVRTGATAISAVTDLLKSLLHIGSPHLVIVVHQPDRTQGCHPTAFPACDAARGEI